MLWWRNQGHPGGPGTTDLDYPGAYRAFHERFPDDAAWHLTAAKSGMSAELAGAQEVVQVLTKGSIQRVCGKGGGLGP